MRSNQLHTDSKSVREQEATVADDNTQLDEVGRPSKLYQSQDECVVRGLFLTVFTPPDW